MTSATTATTAVGRFLAFFRKAGRLKDVTRNSWTREGRRESVAEHSWRLALMAVALEDELPGIDHKRLLQLLLVHDLGEAIRGDIPAPLQGGADKTAAERADVAAIAASLPPGPAARIRVLWKECAAAETPEARLVKGLDRIETCLQHVEGANPAGFDYAFNLGYGREHTDRHPLLAALREPVDAETAHRAREG
ncbi:HD family hydrolase [Amaricoccus sp.]|uniref:HD domain-containing protein n=1 Tax=Amaricoccus sp. TaxID=1872485 RepID=UPI001B4FC593|nr:HD domain-containing protein [Amaricoccus sp.]MBP6999940.1 HD domain-containing protein [Amaricoccus sp.]